VTPSALTDPFTALTDLDPLIKYLEGRTKEISDRLAFAIAKKHAVKKFDKVL
jgi:hypothetical protein